MAEWTKATVLKTVVLRTPVYEWLDPMKEAPSKEGAFLVPATPPSGRHRGWVLGGYVYCQPELRDIQSHRFTMVVTLP